MCKVLPIILTSIVMLSDADAGLVLLGPGMPAVFADAGFDDGGHSATSRISMAAYMADDPTGVPSIS